MSSSSACMARRYTNGFTADKRNDRHELSGRSPPLPKTDPGYMQITRSRPDARCVVTKGDYASLGTCQIALALLVAVLLFSEVVRITIPPISCRRRIE